MATTTANASLQNLTVPVADVANTGQLMPKLQFRFRVVFTGFGMEQSSMQLTKQVIDCSRPNVNFTEVTLHSYNSTTYVAGKHAWQPVTMNIRDDQQGNVSKLVGQQLQQQLDFMQQSSSVAGSDYKFSCDIEMLDGGNGSSVPVVLEKWELVGCFLQAANYNTLNYATSDAATVAMTIRFDNAVQTGRDNNPGSGGVGQSYDQNRYDASADLTSSGTVAVG